MKKIEPGKRSDPGKLAREREAIRKDLEKREAPKPGLLESVVSETVKKINKRRQRRSGYGAPPQVPGAMQHGHKEYRDT